MKIENVKSIVFQQYENGRYEFGIELKPYENINTATNLALLLGKFVSENTFGEKGYYLYSWAILNVEVNTDTSEIEQSVISEILKLFKDNETQIEIETGENSAYVIGIEVKNG